MEMRFMEDWVPKDRQNSETKSMAGNFCDWKKNAAREDVPSMFTTAFVMGYIKSTIHRVKNIALVAHDNMKNDLVEWAQWNKPVLQRHNIFATGTTGRLMEAELEMSVTKFQSGPLGGDQQIGAFITEGKIDFLIFFWDPLEPQPHDPDVKALLRIALVWNIPTACNRATADFLISSVLMDKPYQRLVQDFSGYHARQVPDKH